MYNVYRCKIQEIFISRGRQGAVVRKEPIGYERCQVVHSQLYRWLHDFWLVSYDFCMITHEDKKQ